MADPLTSATPVSAPQTNSPAPQPQAPVAPVSAPAPQADKQAPAKPVNLHEIPEFRQVQSQYEKQLAAERKARQELEMRGMDDFEKLQYTNQQLQEQLQSYQQIVQEAQVMQQRQQALSDIAAQTGAPLNVLQDATDPDDAWRKAVGYMRAQLAPTPAPQAPPQVTPANPWAQPAQTPPQPAQQWQPDLGGGNAMTAQARIEQQFSEAAKNRDPFAYIAALRASQGG